MDEKKILIVDDEKPIVDILMFNLQKEGAIISIANDGEEALTRTIEDKPDIILLDVMLPKLDGFTVCKQIRQKKINCPIIMLTAKEDVVDKIIGLEIGADDYMTKPFSIREVIARIKANLRKYNRNEESCRDDEKTEESKIRIKDMLIDKDRYVAIIKDRVIDLTNKEFDLLQVLSSTPNQVYSREKILKKVWGYDYYGDARAVDVAIRRLREKIEESSTSPKYILTKRGMGYYIPSDK